MSEQLPKAASAVRDALRALEKAGIPCAPLHGLEHWPKIGRDADLLVAPEHQARAFPLLRSAMEAAGYECACPPNAFGPCVIGFLERAWESGVELHLVPGVRWRWVTFALRPNLQPAEPFPTDPWASFAKRMILPLLAGGKKGREQVAAEPLPGEAELAHIRTRFGRLVSLEHLDALLAAVRDRDPAALERLAPGLRQAFSRAGAFTLPFRLPAFALRAALTKVRSRTLAISPVLAIVGSALPTAAIEEELRSGPRSAFTGWDFSTSVSARRRAAGMQKIPVCFLEKDATIPSDVRALLTIGERGNVAFSGQTSSLSESASVPEIAAALRRLAIDAFFALHP